MSLSRGEKIVLRFFLLSAVLFVGVLAWGIGTSIQEEKDREQWAADCHAQGKVIVPIGNWNHCMTWEEAKEKGIDLGD